MGAAFLGQDVVAGLGLWIVQFPFQCIKLGDQLRTELAQRRGLGVVFEQLVPVRELFANRTQALDQFRQPADVVADLEGKLELLLQVCRGNRIRHRLLPGIEDDFDGGRHMSAVSGKLRHVLSGDDPRADLGVAPIQAGAGSHFGTFVAKVPDDAVETRVGR